MPRSRVRWPLLVWGLAAVLGITACTSPEEPTGATATAGAPTTAAAPTPTATAAPSPVPAAASAAYTTATCDEPPAAFALLCEVHDLIRTRHVAPPEDGALAAAAAAAVEADPQATDATFTCALPAAAFVSLCDALAGAAPVDAADVEAAVRGMVTGALDPHSAYQDAAELDRLREDLSGQVEGIGALVTTEDTTADDPSAARCPTLSATCRLVVVSVFEGSPADRSGLREGDRILRVDGADVAGRTIDDVVVDVRGPAGTEVELTVDRGGELHTLTITRAAIDLPVLDAATVGDTVYLRLTVFTSDADDRLRTALQELIAPTTTAVVLDLRGNPGGALEAAVGVASEFLADGTVLRTESPIDEQVYEVRGGGAATDPSLAVHVLVDRGSASASEVVAASLQEAGRATVVGERSFGKDTVQQTFELDASGALKLTVARWVTTDGDGFGEGVTPDVPLEVPAGAAVEEVVAAVLAAVAPAG